MMLARIACAVLGIVFLGEAGWIHAKAVLAQVLIAHAWERARNGEPDAKPWPWADTRPVARLTFVGRAARPLTVLDGASGRNLAFGPAHDPASALPGAAGNSVIAGHRDTHFRLLRETRAGDRLVVERPDGSLAAFTVTDRRVVDSRVMRIALDADVPRLTLVTCYPFDAVEPRGPLRLVVTADRAQSSTPFTWHTAVSR
ncbi:MAG TPA: class GN sortase [Steroidobacteraceae bacterium]|nr:class GN sortase [Steroidobacteraceae bacterium]